MAGEGAPATEITPALSQAPKPFADLKSILPAWRDKAKALHWQTYHRYLDYINLLRYEVVLPGRQQLRVSRPLRHETTPVVLDAIYLRDRCSCQQCVSPSSGNKSFSTAEIPETLEIQSATEDRDGTLHIRWKDDISRFNSTSPQHVTVFPEVGMSQLLKEKSEAFAPVRVNFSRHRYERKLWDKTILTERLHRITYEEFMAGGEAFRQVARELAATGLVFLTGVPPTETAVADVALKFGAIKETFYGRTWDVISKPDAENVAYTSAYLGLHSDMLYLESPPRIQLLHCLKNSCAGGESIFSDAFYVAATLRNRHPWAASRLSRVAVPYHYNKNGFFYRQSRPVFDFSGKKPDAHEVWWSPPFQAPFHKPVTDAQIAAFRSWHKAARMFQGLLENQRHMFQYKLQSGECVLFDNRRVLHGRREFDARSGSRWLKGTYVADEDFVSTLNRVYDEERTETAERAEARQRRRRDETPAYVAPASVAPASVAPESVAPASVAPAEDEAPPVEDFFSILERKIKESGSKIER